MKDIKFPVKFQFKVSSFANDFTAYDADGKTIAYVRQKMFKLKEDIQIFDDESKSEIAYTIKADRWLDFSAAYTFLDAFEMQFGKIVRKGWRSMWKAHYQIVDQYQNIQYDIREENGWVKVMDSIVGEIPVLNMLTGYMFNPTYIVTDLDNRPIVRLKKEKSLLGRNFTLDKLADFDDDDDDRIMLGLMMMILLERRRG